jgi:hypothetical protein
LTVRIHDRAGRLIAFMSSSPVVIEGSISRVSEG